LHNKPPYFISLGIAIFPRTRERDEQILDRAFEHDMNHYLNNDIGYFPPPLTMKLIGASASCDFSRNSQDRRYEETPLSISLFSVAYPMPSFLAARRLEISPVPRRFTIVL
jgi:hypothetical protein